MMPLPPCVVISATDLQVDEFDVIRGLTAENKAVLVRPIAVDSALDAALALPVVTGPAVTAVAADPEATLLGIIDAVASAQSTHPDLPVIVASTHSGALDAQVAATLAAPVVLAVAAGARDTQSLLAHMRLARAEREARYGFIHAIVATGALQIHRDHIPAEVADWDVPVVLLERDAVGFAAVPAELQEAVATALATPGKEQDVVTPLRFERMIIERAKSHKKHIVLPEGEDDRILTAAAELLRRDVVELTILGDPEAIAARAAELDLDLSAATLLNPADSEHFDDFVATYVELRKHKGVDEATAQTTMRDISYFATMMIYKGLADGMVSGAVNTTAHTIKPSFEIIKTRPGVSTVSSTFFMCLEGRMFLFGDCAVNPNPTAEQLAEIALASATTAAQFGVEPKVAMLSYSTGASGAGADVDRMVQATALAQAKAPELAIDGPLQFDAAFDPGVGKKKAPDSPVAGAATVYVVPDLEAGNIAYKAIQRTAGALAVGPVMQGLNGAVNDLSRGATVDDIVNTVAITAIQAHTD